ncbi:hypothetical protein E4695_04700 [Alcaligenaceae bacterium 429]|nr:hypothetical protein E4695_04700 [Alcaligenaceae bacterium 429]
MKLWSALICICLALAAAVWAHSDIDVSHVINTHIGTLISISTTLLGFSVSSAALLYAVADTRLARNLQRTGHFGTLLQSLFSCALFFFVSLSLGTVYLFLPNPLFYKEINLIEIVELFLTFVIGLSYTSLIPLSGKFWLLLSNIRPDNPDKLE